MKETERFSNRVEQYLRYRPHYPQALADALRDAGVLRDGMHVADIGSGTGFSSELFLQNGCSVTGIEPNREMREAGDAYLQHYPAFTSKDSSAETTLLPDGSVDLVIAGQAFHWFDKEKFRAECRRILKPGAHVVLIWNDRQTDTTDFLKSYEDFLKYFGTDYREVNHKNISDDHFDAFFGAGQWKKITVPNSQECTFEALRGRVFSSSYVPSEDSPESAFMSSVLKKIFLRYQQNGLVHLLYDCNAYFGTIPVNL